jgi:hypothetical protein
MIAPVYGARGDMNSKDLGKDEALSGNMFTIGSWQMVLVKLRRWQFSNGANVMDYGLKISLTVLRTPNPRHAPPSRSNLTRAHPSSLAISGTSDHFWPSPLFSSITSSMLCFPSPVVLSWMCGQDSPSSGGYSTRPSIFSRRSFKTQMLL